MTTTKENARPESGTGGKMIGGGNPDPTSRPRLSDHATAYIDGIVKGLATGMLGLQCVPVPLADLYHLGHLHGAQSGAHGPTVKRLAAALADAECDRDTYYERLCNPGKRLTEMKQRRMDQALEAAEHRMGRILDPGEVVAVMVEGARPRGKGAAA